MAPNRNPGRVAGFWYLLLVLIGPLRLIYIPNKLFVHGDATASLNNFAAHAWLFRLGIVADLAAAVVLTFLTLALYRLFAGGEPGARRPCSRGTSGLKKGKLVALWT